MTDTCHGIRVKKVGSEPGFCRELFKAVDGTEMRFVRQEDFPGTFVWYTASKDWEPSAPTESYIEVVST